MIFSFQKKVHRPPFKLLIVATGMFLVSLQGWIRLFISLINWSIFTTLEVRPGVWYLAASGLFQGGVYLVAAVTILFSLKRYKEISIFLLLVGLAGLWFDRIFVATSQEARTSLPFVLISSTVLTCAAIGIINWDTIVRKVIKLD